MSSLLRERRLLVLCVSCDTNDGSSVKRFRDMSYVHNPDQSCTYLDVSYWQNTNQISDVSLLNIHVYFDINAR